MKNILILISFFFPWPLRRWMLTTLFGYQIHPTCKIGFSWVFPKKLIMDMHSTIGHLTVCKNLDIVHLKQYASIGRGNWITAFPSESSAHFSHQKDRHPQLILGEHSAITNRHLIDCTASVTIGNFSTFAGFQSQILSHSIDLEHCQQSSAPVTIGDYCFIGTNCVLLGNSVLPNFSVLGAKSLLNKKYSDTYYLYGGVPALPIKNLSKEILYFSRPAGFVN
jgi:acetyltransferase-like isoleucine patch superfamily enzyme